MQRCRLSILFLGAVALLASAQTLLDEAESQTILNLLETSHQLSLSLPLAQRVELLQVQLHLATALSSGEAREWATELFHLSFELNPPRRAFFMQNEALSTLVRADPSQAVALLHTANVTEVETRPGSPSPKMQLVNQVFSALVERGGERALPHLLQEADLLRAQGYYPYLALGYATMQATSN